MAGNDMYPELRFDVIMFPCSLGIILYQETFFSNTMLIIVENIPSDIRFPKSDPC